MIGVTRDIMDKQQILSQAKNVRPWVFWVGGAFVAYQVLKRVIPARKGSSYSEQVHLQKKKFAKLLKIHNLEQELADFRITDYDPKEVAKFISYRVKDPMVAVKLRERLQSDLEHKKQVDVLRTKVEVESNVDENVRFLNNYLKEQIKKQH